MEISEKPFMEAIKLRLFINELYLLYRTQHPQHFAGLRRSSTTLNYIVGISLQTEFKEGNLHKKNNHVALSKIHKITDNFK
jgi:hypothetical protein